MTKANKFHELLSENLSRRQFIRRAIAAGVSAGALSSLLQSQAFAQDTTTIQWWDQFAPLVPLHETLWNSFSESHPGVSVEYTEFNPSEMGQALQLAFRSGQAPDVHTLVGLGLPASQLIKEEWFSPLVGFDTNTPFLREALLEGITRFNGEVYSFPIFTFRQHQSTLWYHKDRMEEAGFDPEVGPRTWDEVREAASAMTSGNQYGLILPVQFTERLEAHLTDLAQMAGASGGIDWQTGNYVYGTEPFVQAMDFLFGFQEDGSLHPASSSLDARTGRVRWLAGEAGMFFDGPWNSGVMANDYPELIDGIGAARLPIPSADTTAYTYNTPPAGTFWVSSQAENPEVITQILQLFTSDEYYLGLAEQMDQPPLDLSAVERADVHPEYRKVIGHFEDTVRLSPDPVVRNANISQVMAGMRAITPTLGEIVQGVFSGGVGNPQTALQQYSDSLSAEREGAVQRVQDQGVEVSLDDWVFANWQPGEDYGPENYE